MFRVYCGQWYVSEFSSYELAEDFVISDGARFKAEDGPGLRIVEWNNESP